MVAAHRRPSGAIRRRRGEGGTLRRLHRPLRRRGLDSNNEILKRAGQTDTTAAARTYLHTIVGDAVPAEKIDTYLERGPEMLSFVPSTHR